MCSSSGHTRTDTKQEGKHMSIFEKSNKCIHCSVQQCAHHCKDEDYCTLDQIRVGTHETDPTVPPCTDCMSFEK